MSKIRAIRFSDKENKIVDQFLEENEFFDFSSLARISIMAFIRNPSVTIHAIKNGKVFKKGTISKGENV